MYQDNRYERISEAGADVAQIVRTDVAIKIADVADEEVWNHPVRSLCRGLARVGIRAIHLYGSFHYLESLTDELRDVQFQQEVGPWIDDEMAESVGDVDVIIDLTNCPKSKQQCVQVAATRAIGIDAHLVPCHLYAPPWVKGSILSKEKKP